MSGCNLVHEGSGKILALAAAMLLVLLMLACSSDTVTPDATIVLSPDATAAPNPTVAPDYTRLLPSTLIAYAAYCRLETQTYTTRFGETRLTL